MFITESNKIVRKELLELPREQSFHESSPHESHPLDDIDLLIAGDMGLGLMRRLERKGIKGIVTKEDNPEKAVLLYLGGSLEKEQPNLHHHGQNK